MLPTSPEMVDAAHNAAKDASRRTRLAWQAMVTALAKDTDVSALEAELTSAQAAEAYAWSVYVSAGEDARSVAQPVASE